jgi:hypothetical protein
MAKGGKKYRLLIYGQMFSRWWQSMLALALLMLIWGGVVFYFGGLSENPLPWLHRDDGLILLGLGGLALIFTFILATMGRMAYVQLFGSYIKLATPFLRLHISYKRIQKTTTTRVSDLFPPDRISGLKRDIIGPISGHTAIILFLTAYPISRNVLKLFLSPFFFYDKTNHFVLIMDDWMGFSREFESIRVSGGRPPAKKKKTSSMGIPSLLDDLRKK